MSYWPVLRASLPWDQPVRYFAVGLVRASGFLARVYDLVSFWEKHWGK